MSIIDPIESKLKLEVLTTDQLTEIRNATLQILAEVGVKFPSEKALNIFAEHGAQADFEMSIVRMSPEFVLEKISNAPREYLLSGRTEGTKLALELIQATGPGGHFLAQKHTRKHIRERWIPKSTHPGPSFDGRPIPNIRDRARVKLNTILTEHQPTPLDDNAQAELKTILDAAERDFGM